MRHRRVGLDQASLGVLDMAQRRIRKREHAFGQAAPAPAAPSALGPLVAGAGGGFLIGGPPGAIIGGAAGAIIGALKKPGAPPGQPALIPGIAETQVLLTQEGATAMQQQLLQATRQREAEAAKAKAQREAAIVGGATAAGATIGTIVPVVGTAIGAAVGTTVGKFIAPVYQRVFRKTVNPATTQDQRERFVLQYWMRFAPSDADRRLAAADFQVRASKQGKGWGWTPEIERYEADPTTTKLDWLSFATALGAADSDEAIYREVMRFHASWGSPQLAASIPAPANQWPQL